MMIGPTVVTRPEPIYSLTDAECDEWRRIVNAMPVDHFAPPCFSLLAQLCRHTIAANRTAQLIEVVCRRRKVDTVELQRLHAMQAVESNAIIRLCRQLRLSPQQVYRADRTGNRPVTLTQHRAPWDRAYDAEEEDSGE
jgi:hypothetical protein